MLRTRAASPLAPLLPDVGKGLADGAEDGFADDDEVADEGLPTKFIGLACARATATIRPSVGAEGTLVGAEETTGTAGTDGGDAAGGSTDEAVGWTLARFAG